MDRFEEYKFFSDGTRQLAERRHRRLARRRDAGAQAQRAEKARERVMMKPWQSACAAACRWLVTISVLMLAGLAVGDAKAQDQAKEAAAKSNVHFDDFERNELGDKYSIVDPDPDRLTLSNGKLVIVGTNPRKNIVLLNESFPGDFVATVTVAMEVAESAMGMPGGNFVGLRYHVDEKNHLLVGISGGLLGMGVYTSDVPEGRNPFFLKALGGRVNAIAPPLSKLGDRNLEGFVPDVETWYLQIRRDGFRYTGFVSSDGVNWTRIGSHDMVQFHGQLGFTVGSGNGPENAAAFDAFSVQQ
jgi:hypothetical protein